MTQHKGLLSNDITKIEFYKIARNLEYLNINMNFMKKNPKKIIYLNNDLKIEGDNNFYNFVSSLCTIGAFSYSSSNFGYGVSIGRYCSLASNIKIMGAHHFPEWVSTSPHFYAENYHDVDPFSITHIQRTRRNVEIGSDVWIGADVVLKSDIKIGNGAIIASNSIVTKDVPPYMIVGGNPAKTIKARFNENIIEKLDELKWWRFHKKNLTGLLFNHPIKFIDQLEERILSKKLEEYTPKIFTKDDLLNSLISTSSFNFSNKDI